jgi:hypothetical protein
MAGTGLLRCRSEFATEPANLNGELRFRSGDQALTINGVNAGSIPAQTWEKVPTSGFAASVLCAL